MKTLIVPLRGRESCLLTYMRDQLFNPTQQASNLATTQLTPKHRRAANAQLSAPKRDEWQSLILPFLHIHAGIGSIRPQTVPQCWIATNHNSRRQSGGTKAAVADQRFEIINLCSPLTIPTWFKQVYGHYSHSSCSVHYLSSEQPALGIILWVYMDRSSWLSVLAPCPHGAFNEIRQADRFNYDGARALTRSSPNSNTLGVYFNKTSDPEERFEFHIHSMSR
jgi:hypothetical protein